jgi:hypothetical protein
LFSGAAGWCRARGTTDEEEDIAAVVAGFDGRVHMASSLGEINIVISARGILDWDERHSGRRL